MGGNPFRDNVVQDAWQSPRDVPEIHASVFQACLEGIESAARGVPDSLLIHGPAGSGKTHLLTRIQRHLTETARDAPDQVLRCVFVFVRLQTSPMLIWQHVRRRLTADLMRRDQGLSQLQRLVAHQIGQHQGARPRAAVLQLRVLKSEDREAVSDHLRDMAATLDMPRDLCVVLEHLVCDDMVRDASAWLAGESLPEGVLAELGLGADEPEDREDTARAVVAHLCRLAGSTLPIVFCFDQIEALQRSLNDEEALYRYARMAADIYDADQHVSLITCVQSAVLEQLWRGVRDADRERMAKREVALEWLDEGQIGKLIRSRLDPVPELACDRAAHVTEPYFPLPSGVVADLMAHDARVPRKVLAECARRFDELQSASPRPRPSAREFLDAELASRLESAEPPLGETTRIVLQGITAVAALKGAEVRADTAEKADLLIGTESKSSALSLRNEADGRSLRPKLQSLLAHTPRRDRARVVVVRDPRLTISKRAVKAREHLAALQSRGASLVEPTIEALAALDALAAILADARAGDLANDGEVVPGGAVLEWIKGLQGKLAIEPVNELLDDLLEGGPEEGGADDQDLADLLRREHVVALEAASRELNRPSERLLAVARRSSDRCLVLDGPPTVLLDMAGVALERGGL